MAKVVPSTVVAIIDKLFPWAETQEDRETARLSIGRTYQGQVMAIMNSVERVPEELLVLEPPEYERFLIAVAVVQSTIKTWEIHDQAFQHIPGVSNLNPIAIIRRLLEKCPDESLAHSPSSLEFISDKDYRDSILLDISGANQALSNGEWKAATVLSGAAIEALLLWALQKRPQQEIKAVAANLSIQIPSPENWKLHQMMEVAGELKIIQPETYTQVKLSKDFRNLIHPGRAVRTGLRCDRSTALQGAAALEAVVRDLTRP